jgi:hypothetical protein
MSAGIIAVIVFTQHYVVPVIFAIGIIYFMLGVVNAFMLHRSDLALPKLIQSIVYVGPAILIYGVLAVIGLLVTSTTHPRIEGTDFGAQVERQHGVLPTPNVPQGND